MPYTKTVVCLANSKKLRGRCVAGKELRDGAFGNWIRPVGICATGELYGERLYDGGVDPELLDVVEMQLIEPRPAEYQTENHLVDAQVRWKRIGKLAPQDLARVVEPPSGPLWINGDHTGHGFNDQIRSEIANSLTTSLKLLQPEALRLIVQTEGADFGNPRRTVRGSFSFGGCDYTFSVTDPVFREEMFTYPDGFAAELQKPILCISLSEKFATRNACYKLIAGVIRTF
jgi:hypothetical protein